MKAIVAAVAIVVLLVTGYLLEAPRYLQEALQWVDGLGIWGPVVFVAMYIAVCVLVIPGSILTLGAGAVFGVIRGALFTVVGSTLGATLAFVLGRTLMREWVESKIKTSRRLKSVDEAVQREGGRLVFLLRLSPLVPFSISNYVYGVTNIKLSHYFAATAVGMLPGIFLYSYIGSFIRRAAELGAGTTGTTTGEWALYIVGLIATVVATVRVTIVAKRALAEHNLAPPEDGDEPVPANSNASTPISSSSDRAVGPTPPR